MKKKTDTVIIGLNEQLLDIINPSDQSVCVIDVKNFSEYSREITFDDDMLFGIYQSSLEASQFAIDDVDTMKEFYQMVVSLRGQNQQDEARVLLDKLKDRNIEVVKGRVTIEDENTLVVHYLEQTTEITFNKLIMNTGHSIKTDSNNPYVFTLAQLIETQLLPESMIVEVKSLHDLGVAKMFSHFGTKVQALLINNVFSEIDHLMFRDTLRESLISDSMTLFNKVTINSIESDSGFGKIEFNHVEADGFPIQQETQTETFTVYLASGEGVRNDFSMNLETLDQVVWLEDLISKKDKVDVTSLYLAPAFTSVKAKVPAKNPLTIRLNSDEIAYYKRIQALDGGLEIICDKDTGKIHGATFYCFESLTLRDMVILMIEEDTEITQFKNLYQSATSVLSVFTDIYKEYEKEVRQ